MISSNLRPPLLQPATQPPTTRDHLQPATTARSARSTAALHRRTRQTTPFWGLKKPSWTRQLGPESRVHCDFTKSTPSPPSLPKKRVDYRVNSARQSGHINSDESTSWLASLITMIISVKGVGGWVNTIIIFREAMGLLCLLCWMQAYKFHKL